MKKKMIKLLILFVIIIFILIGFSIINGQIYQDKRNKFVLLNNSDGFAYQVESSYVDNNYFVIEGWFIELESVQNKPIEVNKNNNLGIVLYDLNSQNDETGDEVSYTGLAFDVDRNKRNDVNEYYKCEFDYSRCGFKAKIKKNNVDIENGNYRLVFKPDDIGQFGIDSTTYISHGKLQYVNPKEEVNIDVAGTDLDVIVDNGYCLAYNKYGHIWVYQYKNKIFWIADKDYCFADDDHTYLWFLISTTQYDLLPNDRKDNNVFFDDKGIYFEDHEITENMNCGKYRVCTCDLPKEYSIVVIETGNSYINEEPFQWNERIRPVFMYRN